MMKSSDMKMMPTIERIDPGTVPCAKSAGSFRYRSRSLSLSRKLIAGIALRVRVAPNRQSTVSTESVD
jgi:hypothetical protein